MLMGAYEEAREGCHVTCSIKLHQSVMQGVLLLRAMLSASQPSNLPISAPIRAGVYTQACSPGFSGGCWAFELWCS